MNATFNHDTAIETQAASRYVLGEMSDEDARAFEEHFFDCPVCAGEVNETASFADNARLALREDRVSPFQRRLRGLLRGLLGGPGPVSYEFGDVRPLRAMRIQVALPLAATLVLGFVAVYQNAFVIPKLESALQPRAVTVTMLRTVRSASTTVTLEPSDLLFELAVDLPFERAFPKYKLEFRSAAGEVVADLEAFGPAPLVVRLPVSSFPDGEYTVTITGLDGGSDIAVEAYRFGVVTREERDEGGAVRR